MLSVFWFSCLLSDVQAAPAAPIVEVSTQTIAVRLVPSTDELNWERVKLGADPSEQKCLTIAMEGEWKIKDGGTVSKDREDRVRQLPPYLLIKNFQAADAGQYDCVDKNGNTLKSYSFYLDVSIENETEVQEVTAGSPIDLLCKVNGSDTVTKTLMKNLTVYTDVEANQDGFRWIRSVRKDDAGEYVCRVEQEIRGNRKTVDRPISLIVNYPPEMSKGEAYLDDVAKGLPMGRQLQLQCPVFASPPAFTSWVQVISDVSEIGVNTTEVHLDEAKLIIPVAAGKEYGRFKCIATNNLGSVYQTFDVTSKNGLNTDVPFVTAFLNGRREEILVWAVNGTVVGNTSSVASERLVGDPVASSSSATILSFYMALLALTLMMAVAS